jgi:hypothetical protein|tara:strand:- start:193 stop:600 length:408 start_codon:yes stop_codon:yes gene_type:complete
MNNLEVLEFKRNLGKNKDRFKNDIEWVCKLFNIKEDGYIKKYNDLGDEMIEKFIEINKLKMELNDLNYSFEKMKYNFIVENDVDIKEELKSKDNRENIVDELYKLGFISSDYFSIMKEYFWSNRRKMNYEFAKWM